VFLQIECNSGGLYVCPGEVLYKSAFLRDPDCVVNPDCGALYCWQFKLGGCCADATVSLFVAGDPNPIYQQNVLIKSPDISGDGFVDLVDFTTFASLITPAPYEVCADLNCDGIVDTGDVLPGDPGGGIFGAHYLHNCDLTIPTDATTWGAIKEMYTD
jgi:hypothetical protein